MEPGKNLDWDLWLGPAPNAPTSQGASSPSARSGTTPGGVCTDFFPHLPHPLGVDPGSGFSQTGRGLRRAVLLERRARDPDIFTSFDRIPVRAVDQPGGRLASDANFPMQVQGQQATLTFGGAGFSLDPQRSAGNQAESQDVKRERPASLDEHWKDLLGAVESRKKPRSHEVLGYRVSVALCLGVRSFLENKIFEFDAKKQQPRAL